MKRLLYETNKTIAYLCFQGEDLWDYAMLGVRSAMGLVAFIMVWAKYTDKEIRKGNDTLTKIVKK